MEKDRIGGEAKPHRRCWRKSPRRDDRIAASGKGRIVRCGGERPGAGGREKRHRRWGETPIAGGREKPITCGGKHRVAGGGKEDRIADGNRIPGGDCITDGGKDRLVSGGVRPHHRW